VAITRAVVMVVELGWRLKFSFEGKLAWGCMKEVHPSLYRGVGGVQNSSLVEKRNLAKNLEIRVSFR
jgi:hypothetical protein